MANLKGILIERNEGGTNAEIIRPEFSLNEKSSYTYIFETALKKRDLQ